MTEKPGGREGGEENVRSFQEWVAERDRAQDWAEYVHRGQLNRSEVARECTFALSCFRSNPGLKSALTALEVRLRDAGILPSSIANEDNTQIADGGTQSPAQARILRAEHQAEQRVKALEEQNAALRAEVTNLRERLRRFEHLDAHLSKTGRLLQT